MSKRTVSHLNWVKPMDQAPAFDSDKRRARNWATRAGHVYEEKFARWLAARFGARVEHGQWYEFEDINGYGMAQPDVVLWPEEPGGLIVIFEVKLTWTELSAFEALNLKYKPLIKHMYPANPLRTVQVCRRLKAGFNGPLVKTVDEAIAPELQCDFVSLIWKPLN
jgi:hypothetical protein